MRRKVGYEHATTWMLRRFKPPFFSGAPDPPASNWCVPHEKRILSVNVTTDIPLT